MTTITNIVKIDNEVKESFKTFGMYNKPFNTSKQQRKNESVELSKYKKETFKDCCCYEVMDENVYYKENTYSRLFIDLEDEHNPTEVNFKKMYESIYEPLKEIINKDFKMCFSGYVKSEELQLNFMETIPENKNVYYIVSVNPKGNHSYSFHVILLDVLFKPEDLFNIFNHFETIFKNSYYKPDMKAKTNSKTAQRLLRLSLCPKQETYKSELKQTQINLEDTKLSKLSTKTLLYYTTASYFEKNNINDDKVIDKINIVEKEEVKEENKDEEITETINLIQQIKENKKLLKIIYNHNTEEFNKLFSIFDFLKCDGCYSLYKDVLFSKTVRKYLSMCPEDFNNEIKLWYERRPHDGYKTLESYLSFLNEHIKPSVKSPDTNGLFSLLKFESRKSIFGKDLNIHSDMTIILGYRSKVLKNIDLKVSEKKTLIKMCIKYQIPYDDESIKDGDVENPINQLITSIKTKADRNSFYDSVLIYELLCSKIDLIQNNFLKHRFCKFSDTAEGIEKYSCAYLKDVNKYVITTKDCDKIGKVEMLKEYNIDFDQVFPKFENLTELKIIKNIYKALRMLKNPKNKLDVKAWLDIFKTTFKTEEMFKYYLSFFHYKFNGVRINKNILNIGKKNCLKTSFVEYFNDFFDTSLACGEQFISRFNGSVMNHQLILIDEVQGFSDIQYGLFIKNIKDYTCKEHIKVEYKGIDPMDMKAKFDLIINTNSDTLPFKLLEKEDAGPMLKRLKLIERVSLSDDILKDEIKFPNLQNNLCFRYQLYKYIKDEFEPISFNDLRFDTKTEFEKFYEELNTEENPQFPDDFNLKFDEVIKKDGTNNRWMIVVKTMNNYVKTFSPDCDIFRDRKTMKLRLSKLGINMDNKFRLKEEDLNAFIKQFTTYKSFDDFVNKKGLVIV